MENVQGDERDVMFFSITFGPDAAGKIPLTFGALNRDGGERRLNVAVTRARQELVVYSSFKGDQLDAERSKTLGVRHLKYFLEYAEKGPGTIAAQTHGSLGGFDSPFEEAVSAALAAKGWQVVSQVGVSGFRVDLGIVHPGRPGASGFSICSRTSTPLKNRADGSTGAQATPSRSSIFVIRAAVRISEALTRYLLPNCED